MEKITIEQLQNDLEGYVLATQQGDIEICANGNVVAVLTAPRANRNWQEFWQERESALSHIQLAADWDSMDAVSVDRERQ